MAVVAAVFLSPVPHSPVGVASGQVSCILGSSARASIVLAPTNATRGGTPPAAVTTTSSDHADQQSVDFGGNHWVTVGVVTIRMPGRAERGVDGAVDADRIRWPGLASKDVAAARFAR